jgi:alcohol dehydrogenase class IV
MSVMMYSVPRNITYGEGSLESLKNLQGRRAVLVTGGSSMKKHGFLDRAVALLREAGMETGIIDGVEPNPSVETVQDGAERMREFEPDWIVAIGGGSALDAAKVMWCFYEHPDLGFEDILTPFSMPKLRHRAKFIAIPSTSGTASEITAFSVITDTKNHIKYPLVSPEMVPDIAILDPVLPAKMPPHVTAHTGMDVMAHAAEALVSTSSTSFTDPYAVEAIKLVYRYLPIAYAEPDNMDARYHMHNASSLAGMAFTNASLGLVHSLAHKIGGEFGVTHGLANAILLPDVIEYNKMSTSKYRLAEEALGVEDLAEAIRRLNRKLNIPGSFKNCEEVDFDEEKFTSVLDRMSRNAFEDPCTLTNPGTPDVADVRKLYSSAYYG